MGDQDDGPRGRMSVIRDQPVPVPAAKWRKWRPWAALNTAAKAQRCVQATVLVNGKTETDH